MTLRKSSAMEGVPEGVLNRQIQSFQFKIQQALNLYDDEIERMSNRLNTTKSKIVEAKEQVQLLERQISDVEMYRSGDEKRRTVSMNTVLTRRRLEHKQRIQQIQNQQREEIESLQHGFEQEMDRLSLASNQQLKSSAASLDSELAQCQHKIDKFRKKTQQIQQDDMNDPSIQEVQNAEHEVIAELQYIVDQRNVERLRNLQSSREKLMHCADAIEGLTRTHHIDIAQKQKEIAALDARYQRELENLQQQHKRDIKSLTACLSQINQRNQKLQNAARHLEQANQTQLSKTMKDLETMKQISKIREEQPLVNQKDITKLQALRSQLTKQRQNFAAKENELHKWRDANESLRKEIWRLRHEIRFKDAPKIPVRTL